MKKKDALRMASITGLLGIICIASTAQGSFTETFDSESLDPLWTTVGDSHAGLKDGAYHFTDANDKNGTELYRTIQTPPSGSFDASMTLALKPFLSPNTKSTFTWNMNGHNGNLSLMFNSFGKVELRHNDYDGKNGGLAEMSGIGYTDGSEITFSIQYRAETDTLEVLYSIDGGEPSQIYSGGGADGGKFEDFVSLRSTAKLFKFADSSDQTTASISQWSLTEVE